MTGSDTSQAGASVTTTASSLGPEATPAGACPEPRNDHNALVARGAELVKPFVILSDRETVAVDEEKVRAGIACFDRALAIIPVDWQLMWMRGKAYQALGDHVAALGAFGDAWRLQPGDPAIAGELGYELFELERFSEAVEVLAPTAEARPDDANLQTNLALALLLNGQFAQAKMAVERALAADPKHRLARVLAARVDEVSAGRRPPPRTVHDLN